MSMTGCGSQIITARWLGSPRVPAFLGRWWMNPSSRHFILGAGLGGGVVSFLTTELMHYMLMLHIGRHRERLLAEGLSAFIVSCLIAKLADINRRQRRLAMARMQVIAEMNHHIRNALASISLSAYVAENQQLIRVISEGVERIDWALREILPREVPLREQKRHSLGYFKHEGADPNECHKSSLR
jgi:signal transduction histidine kinase